MNPGPIEETGKVAVGIVEAMKQQPALLAMFIVIVVLLAIIWRVSEGLAVQREREVKLIYDQQTRIQDLLSKCVVVQKPLFGDESP